MPLSGRQTGVKHRQLVADHGPQAIPHLRHEAHLRDQDDCAAPGRERLRDGGQVDVGLARRGHPLEQQLAPWRQRGDGLDGRCLLLREVVTRRGGQGSVLERIALQAPPAELDAAERREPPRWSQQASRIDAHQLGELAHAPLPAVQRLEQGSLHRRAPRQVAIVGHRTDHALAALGHLRRPQRPFGADHAVASEPLDPRGPAASWGAAHERGIGDVAVSLGQAVQLRGQLIGSLHDPSAQQARLEAGRQHRREGRADRRAVVAGDLLRQGEQVRREHRRRDHRLHHLHVGRRFRLAGKEIAERQAMAIGNEQERTGGRVAELGAEQVAERSLRSVGEGLDRDAHRPCARAHRRSLDPWSTRRIAAGLGLDDLPDALGGLLRVAGLVDHDVVVVAGLCHPALRVTPPALEAGFGLGAATPQPLGEVLHGRRHDEDEQCVGHLLPNVARALRADRQDRVAAGGQDAAHLVDRGAVPVPVVVCVLEQPVALDERLELGV